LVRFGFFFAAFVFCRIFFDWNVRNLFNDYFCNPDIGWIVEQRSDNSAHET
jgi:hypothetical protein